MIDRMKQFAIRLHKDETGPNTVEWILLIIIALVILIAVYFFADYALERFNTRSDELKQQGEFLK